jgi:MFS family permease
MTMPASAPRHPQSVSPPGGLHYSWVIVGILVVVQVIGSAISQSAGIMVAPLRDPHGAFGWGIGTIGALMAVYYVVGAVFAPISGWLGERYGAPVPHAGGRSACRGGMVLLGLVRQPWHFLSPSACAALTHPSVVPLMAAVSGWFRCRLAWRPGSSGGGWTGRRPAGAPGGLL